MATQRGRSVPVSMVPNPFWSRRARDEHVLQRLRPEDLPVVPATPEEEDLHSLDGLGPTSGRQAVERSAEMRSARSRSSEGRGLTATPIPKSWVSVKDLYKVTFERDAEHFKAKADEKAMRSQRSQETGKQTSGPMPVDEKNEEASRGRGGARLEEELGKQLVQDLLEQNQALQAELQRLTAKIDGAAEGSSSAWSKVSEEEPKFEDPKTPREGTSGVGAKYTPHGTRVPEELPEQEMPRPPPPEWRGGFYPPPPGWTLDHYEMEEMKRPGRSGDWVWVAEQERRDSRQRQESPGMQWWKDEVYRLQQRMHEMERSSPMRWGGPPVGQQERVENGDRGFQEQLKAVPITLPVLSPVTGDQASLEAGDWLAQLKPYIADIADHAGPWWDKVLEMGE